MRWMNGTAAFRLILLAATGFLSPMDLGALAQGRGSVGAAASETLAPAGQWLAEDVLGGGVIDNLQTVLEIDAGGAVTGTGGCNRIRGTAAIEGAHITFGPVMATKMACAPAVMDQEQKFLSALTMTRSFRINALERKLILLDADGKPVMTLAAL